MVVLYFLLLLLTDVCGLVLTLFTLPGLWLMLAGAGIYSWLTNGHYIGMRTLIVLLGLAIFAEIAEAYFGGAGAKKAGASRWGIAGGLIGSVVGGIVITPLIPQLPGLGTLIGICVGSFGGAFGVELLLGKPLTESAMIGFGAAKGKLTGIAGKVGIGLLMMVITFITALPYHRGAAASLPTTRTSAR